MKISDKIIQLLNHKSSNQKEIENELGVKWDDIRETVGVMRINGWISELPAYLAEIEKGRRYYITPQGKDEYSRRVKEGCKK
jgi:predicted transcriptional regulator